jgi:hypothetical protein
MLIKNLRSEQVPVPHEPGQWMVFNRLNKRKLTLCEEKRQSDAMLRMVSMGAEALSMIREATKGQESKESRNPIEQYDLDMLLEFGIHSWSYDESVAAALKDEDGGLDPVTSDWAATQILEFNGLIPAAREAELGN